MDCLKALYESLGVKNITTYKQSGNVIFDSVKSDTQKLSKKIEQKIESELGFSVPVLTKTQAEIHKIIKNNPYTKDTNVDPSKLYVTFLSASPKKTDFKKLLDIESGTDTYHLSGAELYLHCPNGYGRTKLTNNLFERVLSLNATTRNWKSVNSLYEIAVADR